MIIAYCGGLTLSIYPVNNPIQNLKNALNSEPEYIIEDYKDFIKVRFCNKFIEDFVKMWEDRVPRYQSNVILFGKILKNIYFDQCRLYENGYFEALLKTDSIEIERIIKEIRINEQRQRGFSDELKMEFKNIYELVYRKIHKHTYIRLNEAFCHLVLNDDKGSFDLNIAREAVFCYFNDITINNVIYPAIRKMDSFEENIRSQTFSTFLATYLNIVYKMGNRFGIMLPVYDDISDHATYSRRIVWALNYIRLCLKQLQFSLPQLHTFSNNLEDFTTILSLRKEVAESMKNAINFYASIGSIILGLFGVILAILKVDFSVIIVLLSILFIIISYKLYKSIKDECQIQGYEPNHRVSIFDE